MPLQTMVIVGLAVLLVAIVAWRSVGLWAKYRGRRVVECPETHQPAGVTVDAAHAAAAAFGRPAELRLASCSRWPERASCGQECLAQIEAAPEDCLVRHILAQWYQGKVCASCKRPFGEIEWAGAKPAVLRPDGVSMEWDRIPAEQLQAILATAAPICFACHTANRLVHEHPELAIDRGRPPAA